MNLSTAAANVCGHEEGVFSTPTSQTAVDAAGLGGPRNIFYQILHTGDRNRCASFLNI